MTLLDHLQNFRDGNWFFGCKFYKNKPMFKASYCWYDGPKYALHFGPFWIEIT